MAEQRQQQQRQVVRSNHTVTTVDGWRLHLLHVKQEPAGPGTAAGAAPASATTASKHPSRLFPVLLVPGLCSSGTYSFDVAPEASLAEWLARQGWDVWIAELRGNGLSDKPAIFSHRSHWFTIDDMVEKDVPAVLSYVCMVSGCTAAHMVGHSMGGMICTAVMARNDATTARVRSVTIVGSSCFLQGSWWQVIRPTMPAVRALYSVPAGATLRLYSSLAFTRLGIQALDVLYFWPSNTDPVLARAVLARNFSSTSPAVVLQLRSAFKPSGLRSAHEGHPAFADPERMAAVRTPVMFITGDKDKMCPWQGAVKQFGLIGTHDKKLLVLGPKSGQATHYGHFDILMGKRIHTEVFPHFNTWLEQHDDLPLTLASTPATMTSSLRDGSAADNDMSEDQATSSSSTLVAPASAGQADGASIRGITHRAGGQRTTAAVAGIASVADGVPQVTPAPCRAPHMLVDDAGAPLLPPSGGCTCADCVAVAISVRAGAAPEPDVLYASRL